MVIQVKEKRVTEPIKITEGKSRVKKDVTKIKSGIALPARVKPGKTSKIVSAGSVPPKQHKDAEAKAILEAEAKAILEARAKAILEAEASKREKEKREADEAKARERARRDAEEYAKMELEAAARERAKIKAMPRYALYGEATTLFEAEAASIAQTQKPLLKAEPVTEFKGTMKQLLVTEPIDYTQLKTLEANLQQIHGMRIICIGGCVADGVRIFVEIKNPNSLINRLQKITLIDKVTEFVNSNTLQIKLLNTSGRKRRNVSNRKTA